VPCGGAAGAGWDRLCPLPAPGQGHTVQWSTVLVLVFFLSSIEKLEINSWLEAGADESKIEIQI